MKKRTLITLVLTIFLAQLNFAGSKPKNIIILIGDGMGLSHISASVLSQTNDPFKEFLSIGLINTCSADNLITDSAASATAISTGYSTNNGKLGIDPSGKVLQNIFEIAKKKNKTTGVVVTCSVTNATPAAFLSHADSRKMEFEIANQIASGKTDFIAGAGTEFFLPKELGGKREDGKNLIDSMKNGGYTVCTDTSMISKLGIHKKFLGLFGEQKFPYANERNYTIGQLTKSAIESLSKNNNGFVLMIEGSQIDWAADKNDKSYLFGEQKDFNGAVNEALTFAKKNKNTLVIVMADHDTGSMGVSGRNKETREIEIVWATKKHTANFVGMFSYGPGSNLFNGIQDNFEVGRKLINLISPTKF